MYGIHYTSLRGYTSFWDGLDRHQLHAQPSCLFCIAGLLVDLATSLLYAATNTLPIQWFSSKLGTANGLVKAGGGMGATVPPLAAQSLIDSLGMKWIFRVLGMLVLATGIPSPLSLMERKAGWGGATSHFDWSLLKNVPNPNASYGRHCWRVRILCAPLFPAALCELHRFVRLYVRWAGLVCDRIGAFNALAVTALINSLSMLAIWPVSSTLAPLFIFAIVNGCANGSFFVCLPTAVVALAPGSTAASISLMTSFWTPGYLERRWRGFSLRQRVQRKPHRLNLSERPSSMLPVPGPWRLC